MKKIYRYIQYLKTRIKRDPKAARLYSVLRILVILVAIRQLIIGNYEGFGVCILSLVLFLMPSLLEDHFKIEIPTIFEAIIYLFIFAAEILGEVDAFYTMIPGWDTILHTLNGFLCAAVGFSMVDLLNRHSDKVDLSPFYLAMASFCFSMTIGVIWEFIECAGDLYFGQDMQKDFIVQSFQSVTLDPTHSQKVVAVKDITKTVIYTASGKTYTIEGGYLDIGILDTMKDLFVNFIGAIVFSVFGYFYVHYRDDVNKGKRSKVVTRGLMIRSIQDEDEKFQIEEEGFQENEKKAFEAVRQKAWAKAAKKQAKAEKKDAKKEEKREVKEEKREAKVEKREAKAEQRVAQKTKRRRKR